MGLQQLQEFFQTYMSWGHNNFLKMGVESHKELYAKDANTRKMPKVTQNYPQKSAEIQTFPQLMATWILKFSFLKT